MNEYIINCHADSYRGVAQAMCVKKKKKNYSMCDALTKESDDDDDAVAIENNIL